MTIPLKDIIQAIMDEIESVAREEHSLAHLKNRFKYHLLKNFEYQRLLAISKADSEENLLKEKASIECMEDKYVLQLLLLDALAMQLELVKRIDKKMSPVQSVNSQMPPLIERLKRSDLIAIAVNRQFKGELKNKVPWNGVSIWLNPSGYRYTGEWKEGDFKGVITHANGTRWSGDFHARKLFTGKGRLVMLDGSSYEGEWIEGRFNGIVNHPNGTLWKGEMRKFKPWTGQGRLIDAEGHCTEGEWKEGVLC